MNGRIYDPQLARFYSPDPYIQAPDMAQNFNRYAYCMNNPLIYADPSGESWWILAAAIMAGKVYHDGVQANGGNANPFQWNWSNASYVVGWSTGGGGNTIYGGIGWNGNSVPIIGYNSNSGAGLGMYSNGSANINYFNVDYDAAAKSVDRGINRAREISQHSNYVIGFSSSLIAGSNGLKATKEFFKTLQTNSDLFGWGLDYSNEMSKVSKAASKVKALGFVTSSVSLMYSFEDYNNGAITGSKFAMDIAMTAYSYVPGVGWAAGLQYYIIDNTVGYNNFMNYLSKEGIDRANNINQGNWSQGMWRPGGRLK